MQTDFNASTKPPAQPFFLLRDSQNVPKYKPCDLLSDDLWKDAASNLANSRGIQNNPEMVKVVDQIIREVKLPHLEMIMHYSLLTPAKLQEACSSNDKVLQLYAIQLVYALNSAIATPNYTLLKDTKMGDQALEKFPELFNPKSVRKLIKYDWIIQSTLKKLILSPKLETTFSCVLEDMLDDASFVSEIKLFADSSIPRACFNTAIKAKKGKIIRKLIENKLIKEKEVQEHLKQVETCKLLKEELKLACEQVVNNKYFIFFLAGIGIQGDESDLYNVAKSGSYQILGMFHKKGADISSAVFKLIQYEQTGLLEQLLKGEPGGERLDPNLKDKRGIALLIEAVNCDKSSIVAVLLAYGANSLIRSPDNQTVFQLAKEKSPRIAQLLYCPDEIQKRSVKGSSCKDEKVEEELVLQHVFERKAQGKQFAMFNGFFIKTKHVVMVVLKSAPFANMHKCYNESKFKNPNNEIHCWVSGITYPIPENFAPSHTSMHTIGLAIFKSFEQNPADDFYDIANQRYVLKRLENSFRTENPLQEYGFKYSYDDVKTHGHGKNPEAAHSAFRQHSEGIRKSSHWIPAPDLMVERESFTILQKHLIQLQKEEKSNSDHLHELTEQIDLFMKNALSIIENRYTYTTSTAEDLKDNKQVENSYQEVTQKLNDIPQHTFTQSRLSEWQTSIGAQIDALQALGKKLQAMQTTDTKVFETERQTVTSHLCAVKDLVINRAVTSAEIPTLKVYSSSLLVENIFFPNDVSISRLKKAICQLIGSSLSSIPVPPISEKSDDCPRKVRGKVIKQLNDEVDFILKHGKISNAIWMQRLASQLALLQDSSTLLDALPPIKIDPNEKNQFDSVSNTILLRYALSYSAARIILDQFWKDICHDDSVLEKNLDGVLELLSQRLFILDADSHDAKQILDGQLFILQTSLLIALSKSSTGQSIVSSAIHKTREFVQLKLGTEKKRYKPHKFFICDLIDVMGKIKDIASAAWKWDPSNESRFKALYDIFYNYDLPEKKEMEALMLNLFQRLSEKEPFPKFDESFEKLISQVMVTKTEVEHLSGSFSQLNIDSSETLKRLSNCLDTVVMAFDRVAAEKELGQDFSSAALFKMVLNQKVLTEAAKEELKKAAFSQIIQRIRINIIQLKELIKKLSNIDQLEADKAKRFQKESVAAIASINEYFEYLNTQEQPSASATQKLKIECVQIVKEIDSLANAKLEKSINKLPSVIEKIKQQKYSDVEIVLDLKSLVKQLNTYLSGKNNKKASPEFNSQFNTQLKLAHEKLDSVVNQWVDLLLPDILKQLVESLTDCQRILQNVYVKKLVQMCVQLDLGIRKQTYYTTENENVTCYLWNGEPFNATPLHTDNDVHLPLVHHQKWASSEKSNNTTQ